MTKSLLYLTFTVSLYNVTRDTYYSQLSRSFICCVFFFRSSDLAIMYFIFMYFIVYYISDFKDLSCDNKTNITPKQLYKLAI